MIQEITFDEIKLVWSQYLWPNRKSEIEPINSMMFMGGYDMELLKKYEPTFWGYFIDDTLAGVNSGFRTSDYSYRSRGLYVKPKYRRIGIGQDLLDKTILQGINEGCSVIWSIPRQDAYSTYHSVGFNKIGPWFDKDMEFGPNCYAFKEV